MLEKSHFIPVGKIVKPHGTSGEAAIRLFPDTVPHDIEPSFIFVEIDNGLVPFRVSGFRYKSDDVVLIKSSLFPSEDKIRTLMDCTVYLSQEEVIKAPADVENLNAFTGYKVIDIKTGTLGEISGIHNISGNPLFIISGAKGEIMVPAVEKFIVDINDDEKTVILDAPEGLLDLNLNE